MADDDDDFLRAFAQGYSPAQLSQLVTPSVSSATPASSVSAKLSSATPAVVRGKRRRRPPTRASPRVTPRAHKPPQASPVAVSSEASRLVEERLAKLELEVFHTLRSREQMNSRRVQAIGNATSELSRTVEARDEALAAVSKRQTHLEKQHSHHAQQIKLLSEKAAAAAEAFASSSANPAFGARVDEFDRKLAEQSAAQANALARLSAMQRKQELMGKQQQQLAQSVDALPRNLELQLKTRIAPAGTRAPSASSTRSSAPAPSTRRASQPRRQLQSARQPPPPPPPPPRCAYSFSAPSTARTQRTTDREAASVTSMHPSVRTAFARRADLIPTPPPPLVRATAKSAACASASATRRQQLEQQHQRASSPELHPWRDPSVPPSGLPPGTRLLERAAARNSGRRQQSAEERPVVRTYCEQFTAFAVGLRQHEPALWDPSPHAPLLQPQPQPMATVPYREGGEPLTDDVSDRLSQQLGRQPSSEEKLQQQGCDHLSSESPTSPTSPTSPPWQQHAQHAPSQATTATPRPLDAFLRPFPTAAAECVESGPVSYECEEESHVLHGHCGAGTCGGRSGLARPAICAPAPPGRQPSKPKITSAHLRAAHEQRLLDTAARDSQLATEAHVVMADGSDDVRTPGGKRDYGALKRRSAKPFGTPSGLASGREVNTAQRVRSKVTVPLHPSPRRFGARGASGIN